MRGVLLVAVLLGAALAGCGEPENPAAATPTATTPPPVATPTPVINETPPACPQATANCGLPLPISQIELNDCDVEWIAIETNPDNLRANVPKSYEMGQQPALTFSIQSNHCKSAVLGTSEVLGETWWAVLIVPVRPPEDLVDTNRSNGYWMQAMTNQDAIKTVLEEHGIGVVVAEFSGSATPVGSNIAIKGDGFDYAIDLGPSPATSAREETPQTRAHQELAAKAFVDIDFTIQSDNLPQPAIVTANSGLLAELMALGSQPMPAYSSSSSGRLTMWLQ